ncbi:unnamed protein product [Phyllotreta striolata]|uniref:Cytochrome P450 n=1 Tax=Phyllotreta striolata TaxID=444603 RepID=A0A9N9TRA1_PHYSR|nr:unnamed protein product [Phyllotreta striolata]
MLSLDTFASHAIAAFVVLVASFYFYVKYTYNYWTRKNVPQLPPAFPFGNFNALFSKSFSFGPITKHYYDDLKKAGHAFGGVYIGMTPHMVMVDERLGRNVLTKDFQFFVNRGLYNRPNAKTTANIFFQDNQEWKIKRPKLTVIFTTAKLKLFFNTIKQCADELEANMYKVSDGNNDVDIYENMGCYFTDVISSLVFGIEAKSFKDPDAAIRTAGRMLFTDIPIPYQLCLFLAIAYPNIAKILRVPPMPLKVENFFLKLVPETMEYRKKNNIYRNDLLQLLIELEESGSIISNDIIAETFNFFIAGFETSTTVSTYLLYELAKRKDIQEKIRKEVNEVLKKYNGEFTYDAMQELPYMAQAIDEAMRKYPPLATLTRVCASDYQIPGTDVIIEKGTPVIIPVLGYHLNPDYFPEPMKFNPDRFEGNVKYEGYLPFGDGPRNCIGERLGLLQSKVGIASLIKKYEFSLSPNMKGELVLDEDYFVTRATDKILLRLKKVEN